MTHGGIERKIQYVLSVDVQDGTSGLFSEPRQCSGSRQSLLEQETGSVTPARRRRLPGEKNDDKETAFKATHNCETHDLNE